MKPVIITVPDSGGRYYLLPVLDMWTDVFTSPGTRTTGNGPQQFAIVGPRWHGKLPAGMAVYVSPTAMGAGCDRPDPDQRRFRLCIRAQVPGWPEGHAARRLGKARIRVPPKAG
ncbi:DUF1254 domain-containing protein [Cupriavidus basilensis]